MTWRLNRPAALTALILAALVLAACSAAAPATTVQPTATPLPPTGALAATTTATTPTAAEFDRLFIDMMVPHHEGAIEMAGVARSRVEHPELKQLVTEILRSQAAEVTQMRRWRQQWYGSASTPPMSQMPMLDARSTGGAPHTMNMAAEVVRLRSAPPPFDLAFIDAMIPHHQSAIDAARLAEPQATRPELKDLARTIIDSQQREIDQMRQWRQDWFGSADQPTGAPTGGAKSGARPSQGTRDASDPHAGH